MNLNHARLPIPPLRHYKLLSRPLPLDIESSPQVSRNTQDLLKIAKQLPDVNKNVFRIF